MRWGSGAVVLYPGILELSNGIAPFTPAFVSAFGCRVLAGADRRAFAVKAAGGLRRFSAGSRRRTARGRRRHFAAPTGGFAERLGIPHLAGPPMSLMNHPLGLTLPG
ncbi:hypothetical protein GCM10009548_85350 [Streptomyces malaysiensis subsp. malaysiensis]